MTNILSVSDARAKLPRLVKEVNKNMDRVLITVKGQPKVAVLSVEELESLEETAEILAIPGALASTKRGLKQAKKRQGTLLSEL
ncbi:type II toxin-antitoxin system prevent-host-death family antitoxin [Candidatus Microgenomates bacterium]|nr:type II toxin-antitoxin system prevent-host-death family antitoxin [Candidatus Microgenomates bacterium]